MAGAVRGHALDVAPRLLGAHITTNADGDRVEIVINEVEAYCGAEDPASHAYRGRTARNEPMFGPPGTIYVYRSYGIHWCVNIVTGEVGEPQAVLIRGGHVVDGIDTVMKRRGRSDHLADGPGKLTQALAIDGTASGTALSHGGITLMLDHKKPPPHVTTPRIGISHATDRPWRFVASAT
jgi:DNA-3-methyladenine glycosylase